MDMRERDTCSAWSTRWLTQQARVLFDIKETITRTREEALALIEGIHRRIVMIVIDGLVRVAHNGSLVCVRVWDRVSTPYC